MNISKKYSFCSVSEVNLQLLHGFFNLDLLETINMKMTLQHKEKDQRFIRTVGNCFCIGTLVLQCLHIIYYSPSNKISVIKLNKLLERLFSNCLWCSDHSGECHNLYSFTQFPAILTLRLSRSNIILM